MPKSTTPRIPLDRSGVQPLYAQIAQQLRQDIRTGNLAPGTVLPSEAALCRHFDVARSVVRQALGQLADEGLIHRAAGRVSTVAAAVEHHRIVQRSTGLFEQFARTGATLRTQVLRLEPAEPPAHVAEFFGTDDTLLLERVRGVGHGVLAFVRTWLPQERLPGLGTEELVDASLHRVMVQRYGLKPGRGRNQIRAVGATSELAHTLKVPEGSPLLMLEGQGKDQHDQPLEWFTTWHRAEQLVFDVEVNTDHEAIQAALPASVSLAEPSGPYQDPDSLAAVEASLHQALDAIRRLRGA